MRAHNVVVGLAVSLTLGACGSKYPNLCETLDPLPPECMEACDPQPGSPHSCPPGFHCAADGFCDFQCTAGGNECGDGNRCTDDGRCIPEDQCENLECFQVDCTGMGTGTTSLSGIVYAPNGTLPLYNVTVYVPNAQIAPFDVALTCDQCGDELSGRPLVRAVTDTMGRFTLVDVPATDNVPVVFQVGRWRRQITVPAVPQCVDTPLTMADTRLPQNQSEGDIPRMALSTGGADALECLLRKIGIDDPEFTTRGGSGRVHLYGGEGGANRFDGGGMMNNATDLWASQASLEAYDVVFLSCEGNQNPQTKGPPAYQAMKSYADIGGRMFASHWHNIWLEAAPSPWDQTLTRVDLADLNSITAVVNTGFARGADLAQWLLNVAASTTLGLIDIDAAQHTVSMINDSLADRWIYQDVTANGVPSVQYMAFTTPLEQPEAARCGKVVFSDIHVASGDSSNPGNPFPSGGCNSNVNVMSPQEKVLAFMIFDIAACIPDVID